MTIGIMVGGHGSEWPSLNLTNIYLPTKLVAGEDLPRGAFVSIALSEVKKIFLTQSKFASISEKEKFQEIFLQGNQLYSEGTSKLSWISNLPLAEDVHSEVASLSITSDSIYPQKLSIVLTITKPVQKGNQILFWFSSQLASELGLPFLTFSHIKDGRYMCSNCSKRFLAPNPLKLHIATSCDTVSSDILWERIINSISYSYNSWKTPFLTCPKTQVNESLYSYSKNCIQALSSSYVSFALQCSQKISSLDNNVRSLGSENSISDQKPSISKHSLSAFKPVIANSNRAKKVSLESQTRRDISMSGSSANFLAYPDAGNLPFLSSIYKGSIDPYTSSSNVSQWSDLNTQPSISSLFNTRLLNISSSNSNLLPSLPSTSTSDPCADVEALVSNLGHGKGRHLCIYCGKVYSRKYGLKIHIRTHTGYKPLKCRICFRPFGDPSNLNKHVRLHSQGGTPYGCELCGKVLVRRRDLERHLRSRHSNVVLSNIKNVDKEEKCSESKQEATNSEEATSINQGSEDKTLITNLSGDTNSMNIISGDTNSLNQNSEENPSMNHSEDTIFISQSIKDTSHTNLCSVDTTVIISTNNDFKATKKDNIEYEHNIKERA